MKKTDVTIGETYLVKIGGNKVEATITREHEQGGWEATTVKTGKTIRIKSPERLCRQGDSKALIATKTTQKPKCTTATQKRHTCQRNAPDDKRGDGPMSLLDAAAHLLGCDGGKPMSCETIVNLAASRGLRKPTTGKTPANTLYSSILREINNKGTAARFVKTERGKFARADNAL